MLWIHECSALWIFFIIMQSLKNTSYRFECWKKDKSVIQHKCDVQRPFPRLLASFVDPTKYVYLWKGFESPTSKSGSHSQTPRWPLNFSSDSNYWITFQYIPLIMFNWEGKYIDVYKLYIWIKVYQPPQRKLINDVAFLDIYMYEWGLYQILWNLQSLYISVLKFTHWICEACTQCLFNQCLNNCHTFSTDISD